MHLAELQVAQQEHGDPGRHEHRPREDAEHRRAPARGTADTRSGTGRPAPPLRLVGLDERMNHFPAQLSGGEQQRVAIARAVAKRPEVLLCDEPTGALDYPTGKLVLEAIERVNRELGTTTAIITHNAAIADMADRVLRMRSGEIVEIKRNEKKAAPADLVW